MNGEIFERQNTLQTSANGRLSLACFKRFIVRVWFDLGFINPYQFLDEFLDCNLVPAAVLSGSESLKPSVME
jgi:hypothetical protein